MSADLQDAVTLAADLQQQTNAERLLGWIYHRSRNGLFSMRRSERDAALSDINHAVQKYGACWEGQAAKRDPNHLWMGEQP